MRIFVAVFPPPEVQRSLIQAAESLPTNAFRLTAPERVHLTLKFLGETPQESLPRIAAALEYALRDAARFDATISGFGVFPSPRRARILWAGIGEGSQQLTSLAHAVETHLEPEGLSRDGRPFLPHLTLGRTRRPTPFDPTTTVPPEHRFTVHEIRLVQSKQDGPGVTYEPLAGYGF